MNIALAFPPFYFEPMYNMPPLGLINIATALKATRYNTRIFDFPLAIRLSTVRPGKNIYRQCAEQVLSFKPDVVGFSVQCTTYPPAIQIAREIKLAKPEARIVFGGHNASFVDELTLSEYPFIDAVVRGEGEITFPELLRAYEGNAHISSIDGVTWRKEERIYRNADRPLIEDLDSLPLSDYSFVPPPHIYRDACGIRRSIAILEVGRGCPHHCIYCSQSLVWRRRARTFSIERLVREMAHLSSDLGAECFLLAYDQFTAKRSFAEAFCKRVIDEGLNHLPWYCISRLDTVDRQLLGLLREAGCESMCYGIDSGSPRTLAFIRKNIDSDILLQRVRETTEQEIVPTLSFVIGFPEETREDLEDTLELALKSASAGNTNILVQMATILPGTDLYSRFSSRLVREVDTYFSLGIEFDGSRRLKSDDQLIDSIPALYSSFYNLPCPAGPLADLNALSNSFSTIAALYPRSFLLLAFELGLPVYELFFLFLDFLHGPDRTKPITPEECLQSFELFAAGLLQHKKQLRREFLPELIRYETCLVKAGSAADSLCSFTIDLASTAAFHPLLDEKVIVERFTFNIPVIILAAKSGRFEDPCPREDIFLLFRQTGRKTEVLEINDFGADFLRFSDGTRDLAAIARELFPKYGTGKEMVEFTRLCAEAAGSLCDLKLFVDHSSGDQS